MIARLQSLLPGMHIQIGKNMMNYLIDMAAE